MYVQIEITTCCNYKCFYCAGRAMPQRHIRRELFSAIVGAVPESCTTISLQGEGEPTVHPRFWELTEQVTRSGRTPYTITNGSVIDATRMARHFPTIGISLDTIDPAEAHRIGRINLPNVLANLDKLLACMGPERIIVHSVYLGQDLSPLVKHLRARGIKKHVVQPLQRKADYARRYSGLLRSRNEGLCTYRCRYLEKPLMRFWNIDGIEMPCRFIKDAGKFASINHTRLCLASRVVPDCCTGCREIMVEHS